MIRQMTHLMSMAKTIEYHDIEMSSLKERIGNMLSLLDSEIQLRE